MSSSSLELIAAQNDVSLRLASVISSSDVAKDKNMVFSPLSFHVVLSMLANGSFGSTRDELLKFLRLACCDDANRLCLEIVSKVFADGSHIGGPKLQIASGIWVDQNLTLKNTFRQVVEGVYKATAKQVDFLEKASQVVSEVNLWAQNQTHGLIKEVLPRDSVDDQTKLILANAMYFKGAWKDKFDASKTKEGDFHLLSGGSVKVPFMTSRKKQYIATYTDYKVLLLPYEQGQDAERQFSMYVFLPHENDGMPTLMEKLSSQPGFLDEHINLFREVVVGNFKLPKFKFSFGFEASEVFKSLGVEKPFVRGGLSEMVDSPMGGELSVSSIFQKSFIEVNEEGTEAAAVTISTISTSCRYTHPTNFVADHPFIFIIREDTSGVVLFIGHVTDPTP